MLLAAAVALLLYRGLRPVPRGLVCAVMFALLVIGLAGPQQVDPQPARAVGFAIDVSDSVPREQQDRARAWAAEASALVQDEAMPVTLEFGASAMVVSPIELTAPPSGSATNLE